MPLFKPQLRVDDEGVLQGYVGEVDFVGAGVAVAVVGNIATVTIAGSGNTIYSGDGTLAGDRVVALNSNSINFNQGAEPFLVVDPTANAETVYIRSFNTTGSDNYGRVVTSTSATNAQAYLEASFNGGAKIGGILLIADNTSARLTYTALTHTFTGGVALVNDIEVATAGTRWGSQSFGASGEFPACALIGSYSGSVAIFPSYSSVTVGSKLILGYWSGAVRSAFEVANVASGNGVAYIMKTGGNVGIGVSATTARLHLPAGSATASTGPLKFTSGTLLGTTEAGAIEYDGTHLYFTAANAGTRYQLDQQSGGSTIYSGNGVIASDRTVDLNGKILRFDEGGEAMLMLDPTVNSEGVAIFANNTTGGNNFGGFSGGTTATQGVFQIQAAFNGGAKIAQIDGAANTTTATLAYTADTHTFTAVDGSLYLDGVGFASGIGASDGTASSSLDLTADAGGGGVGFDLRTSDGAGGTARIFADAVASSIDYTADDHFFVGVSDFVVTITDPTAGGNTSIINASSSSTQGSVVIGAGFDNDSKVAAISILANTTASSINYLADTHTFSGTMILSSLAGTGSRAVLADATGTLSAPISDLSVKEDVMDLTYGLDIISRLRPVSFMFKDDWKRYGEGMQIGFIAQEIQNILPNSVFTTPSTGKMGYHWQDILPILTKAIQEQQSEIDSLRNQIRA